MAEQNLENNTNQGQNSGQEDRTFSQDEVNSIVKSRLAEEKKKYADYEALKEKAGKYDAQQEEGKSELQKALDKADKLQKQLDDMNRQSTARQTRDKVSKETGVPADLLTGEDEESCKAQAEAILKFARPGSYPGTKPNTRNTGNSSQADDAMRAFARQIFQ